MRKAGPPKRSRPSSVSWPSGLTPGPDGEDQPRRSPLAPQGFEGGQTTRPGVVVRTLYKVPPAVM